MKNLSFLSGLLLATLILLFSQCEKGTNDPYRFQFQFITEDYKPLNYVENDSLTGLAPRR